jgi:hypothetical protein
MSQNVTVFIFTLFLEALFKYFFLLKQIYYLKRVVEHILEVGFGQYLEQLNHTSVTMWLVRYKDRFRIACQKVVVVLT